MKRILILIKGLGRGGAEQLIASAVPHWGKDRFEYEVAYLLPLKDAFVSELEAAGIPVHCLDGARGIGWTFRLRGLVRERRIDIVHVHSPVAAVGTRLVLGKQARIVYTEHNVWPRYRKPTRWANALTYGRNDHVFAVSEEVRSSITRASGDVRRPAIETLHHGIDQRAMTVWRHDGVREELGVARSAPLVGTVANFKVHKGHRTLLRSINAVHKKLPDALFVLVGVGPLEDEIRTEAEALGLGDTVIFAGFREDAPRIMAALDLFVLPSEHEGLPIALVEAMALGRPVIATRVGGTPEVVDHGRHGLLVPPNDPAALTDAIVAVLADPCLAERLGREAQERSKLFDISTAVRRMEEVYEGLFA